MNLKRDLLQNLSRFRRIARRVLHLRGQQRGGQSVIEFAIVLPVMLIMLTGLLWWGLVFLDYFNLTNAVDAGSRTLALYRGTVTDTWDPCNATVTALYNAAPRLSQSNLNITITITPYGGSSASYPPGQSGSCTSQSLGTQGGGTVQVQATYPLQLPIFNWATAITLADANTQSIQ